MTQTRVLVGLFLLGILAVLPALAQSPDLYRSPVSNKKESAATTQNPNRSAEIFVELAWISDPITFPYFLEAHIQDGNLEVRGFVPNKMVRDKAIALARLHAPLNVLDLVREHPSLAVEPTLVSAAALQNNIKAALRESYPRGAGQFDIQCRDDGKVIVNGAVMTLEDKLLVSQVLRRQHGVTSILNLTEVSESVPSPSNIVQSQTAKPTPVVAQPVTASLAPANAKIQSASSAASTPAPAKTTEPAAKGSFFSKLNPLNLFNKDAKAKEEVAAKKAPAPQDSAIASPYPVVKNTPAPAPRIEPKPMDTTAHNEPPSLTQASQDKATSAGNQITPIPTNVAPPAAPAKTAPQAAVSLSRLKKMIEDACPGARPVQITQKTAGELNVEFHARTSSDGERYAVQILQMPELQNYQVVPAFIVDQPVDRPE